MHIVVNISKQGKKIFSSTLLRESYREGGKTKKRTIANLSHCTDEEIAAMRLALKHKKNLGELGEIELKHSRSVGATWTIYQVAKRLGIEAVLGDSLDGKMALWQVIARVIKQGSRLSSVRIAEDYSAGDVLGIRDGFTEDHLYRNLRWISEHQAGLEDQLWFKRKGSKAGLFLYDVTSSYLEGDKNELAEYGYNRDKKKGKKQIVIGLLCDDTGKPLSIEVFRGNTSDVETLGSQIKKAAQRFGCDHATFVGDKGMIKQAGIETLATHGFHYITTITKPQIEGLIKTGMIQLGLFENELCEVIDDTIRYVLRRNPFRADEMAQCRQEKKASIQKIIAKKNLYLTEHPAAKESVAVDAIEDRIEAYRLASWLSIEVVDRQIILKEAEAGLTEMSKLDGCYVMKTDLPANVAKETIHDRYKDLAEVEWAFRTCKTGLLELRPIFAQTEESTRGHAFIVMLAYMIVQKLRQAWKDFDLTVEEGIDRLANVSMCEIWVNGAYSASKIATPKPDLQRLLDPLGITIPQTLPRLGAKIVTRKKLQSQRKDQ